MRWRLIILTSLIAALLAVGLWSAIAIGFFGGARGLARHDWLLLTSALVPLGMSTLSGVFVYRHTARRRKTQAILTATLSLLLSVLLYVVTSTVFVNRLYVPRTSEQRHARLLRDRRFFSRP